MEGASSAGSPVVRAYLQVVISNGAAFVERRLAAILAADVVGYSRLIAADEAGALGTLRTHRTEFIEPKIAEHRGRVVKLMGDGMLVEFPSVVDAVQCAVEIQKGMIERNGEIPEERRIWFRIGVNLGDIIVEDDDIHGDGVNVAARLEALAEPGGICVSRTVRDHVQDKLPLVFNDLGERTLKNIPRPVHVCRVEGDDGSGSVAARKPSRLRRIWPRIASVAALVMLVLAMASWQPWAPGEQSRPAQSEAVQLPNKPSIAVLPFANLSGDNTQEYFAHGMADDIITDLSKISGLFVIARNSSFQFESRDLDIRQIADELGVRYVLQGSVQRAGDQVRINAQLVDAETGGNVWAERFDGEFADVFDLQNQVTRRIVNSLAVTLTAREQELGRTKTADPDAHDVFLRGWAHYQRNTPQDYAKAIPYFEQAIERDPHHARAFAALAAVYWNAFANGRLSRGGEWVRSLDLSLTETFNLAADKLAQALTGDADPLAYQISSGMLVFKGRYEEAIDEAQRAIALNGNDPAGYEALGKALIFAGKPSRSIDVLRMAIRLDPHYAYNYQSWLGLAQFGLEEFEAAARSLAEASQRNPDDERILIPLAATYGMLGREQEGRQAVAWLNGVRELESERLARSGLTPGIDLFLVGPLTLQDLQLWPFRRPSDRARLREGLARVGVPATGQDDAESPEQVPGALTVDVAAAKRLFDRGAKFVDVRGPSWNLGHIPGAAHLFLQESFTETSLASIAGKDEELVFYCMGPSCLLSSEACARAVSWGYENVYYFRQGFPAWQSAGHPVEVPG